jgi:hypothetical protein
MIKRTTKMSVTTVLRQRIVTAQPALNADCPTCRRRVEVFPRDGAMRVLGMDACDFDCLVNDGAVHTVTTINGGVWVCKDSLFQDRKEVI